MDVDDLYDLFIQLALELQKYNDLGCEVRDNREERRAARQQVDMETRDALSCVNKNQFPSFSEKAMLDGLEWYLSEMRFCKRAEDHNNFLLALISESPECWDHSSIAEVIVWIKKKYPSLSNARQVDAETACRDYSYLSRWVDFEDREERMKWIIGHLRTKEFLIWKRAKHWLNAIGDPVEVLEENEDEEFEI